VLPTIRKTGQYQAQSAIPQTVTLEAGRYIDLLETKARWLEEQLRGGRQDYRPFDSDAPLKKKGRLTPAEKAEIIRLKALGWSNQAISRKTFRADTTITNLWSEHLRAAQAEEK
jgi:DNA-binding NarL/FixJ family response regulator